MQFHIIISLLIISSVDSTKWFDLFPTGSNVLDSDFPNQWIEQRLDHSNPIDLRTFRQRYLVNDAYFNSSGPAFLFFIGEGALDSRWMSSQQPIKYAQAFNGIFFMLEHRYYGQSGPYNISYDPLDLQYLTSSQALGDMAAFVVQMNHKYTIDPDKWVVIGGSYAGNLVTWFRSEYPHLVVGAVAASAPVLAHLDFQEFYQGVESSIRVHSELCGNNIGLAFDQVNIKMKTSNGRAELTEKFHADPPLEEIYQDPKALADFYHKIAMKFGYSVQYNRDNTTTQGIDWACGYMNNSSQSPLDNLAEFSTLNNAQDSTVDDSVYWLYQTCTEFGFMQDTSDTKRSIFGDNFPLEYVVDDCSLLFGDEFSEEFVQESVNRINVIHGGLEPKDVTNVLSIHGTIDPWHVLGVTKNLTSKYQAILIEGASHCQVFYDQKPGEVLPKGMIEAQARVIEQIGLWLNQTPNFI